MPAQRSRKLPGRWQRIYDRLRAGGYGARDVYAIATAHRDGDAAGFDIEWGEDPEGADSAGEGEAGPWWYVAVLDRDRNVLDSLAGIDLGDTGPDAHHSVLYQYDAEAQVLSESLASLKR